jgi:hypothetical protein
MKGGFATFIKDREGFPHERNLLSVLPYLDVIKQIEWDIALHSDAIHSGNFKKDNNLLASDSKWKRKLIDIFRGKEKDPQIISTLVNILNKDIASHQGRIPDKLTGSNQWNSTWIEVYKQWLEKLRKMRGII